MRVLSWLGQSSRKCSAPHSSETMHRTPKSFWGARTCLRSSITVPSCVGFTHRCGGQKRWVFCGSVRLKLEYRPMPKVMAAQPNIGGYLCKTSVIPFLVPCHKVWLMATAQLLCSNAADMEECKTWMQSAFRSWKNSVRGQEPPKNVYTVYQPRRWPKSDVGAITNLRRETGWNLLGCTKLANGSQSFVGRSSPYCEDVWRKYCCLWSPYGIGQTIIYSSCRLFFFFFFSSPNLSRRRVDVCHTCTHCVALVWI